MLYPGVAEAASSPPSMALKPQRHCGHLSLLNKREVGRSRPASPWSCGCPRCASIFFCFLFVPLLGQLLHSVTVLIGTWLCQNCPHCGVEVWSFQLLGWTERALSQSRCWQDALFLSVNVTRGTDNEKTEAQWWRDLAGCQLNAGLQIWCIFRWMMCLTFSSDGTQIWESGVTVTMCFPLKHHFTGRAAKRSCSNSSTANVFIWHNALCMCFRAFVLPDQISGTLSVDLETFIVAEASVYSSSSWHLA